MCLIEGEVAAEPLLHAAYEEVLVAGGNPIVNLSMQGQAATYFKHATDEQLEWVSPVSRWGAENADVRIMAMASANTRELSAVAPERQTTRQRAMEPVMTTALERAAKGEFRWALTLFPTHAYAAEAFFIDRESARKQFIVDLRRQIEVGQLLIGGHQCHPVPEPGQPIQSEQPRPQCGVSHVELLRWLAKATLR